MSRRITLYSKPGCHLCEDVLVALQRLADPFDLAISEVDITSASALFSRYRFLIPVVDIEHGPVLVAPIGEQELRQALAGLE